MGTGQDTSEVIDQLIEWVNNFVSEPSDDHLNHTPCPFALTALKMGNVVIHHTDSLDSIYYIKMGDPEPGVHHLVLVPTNDMTAEDFAEFIHEQNEATFGWWVSAMHPDVRPNKGVWKAYPWDDIGLFLVQCLDELCEASASLATSGYYESVTDDYLDHIALREAKRNAWNEIESRCPFAHEEGEA
jgi:hypothetical protein